MSTRCLLIPGLILACIALPVCALINPNFTPNDLIEQADTILALRFTGIDDGMVAAEVQEVIKGDFGPKKLEVDLYSGPFEAQGESLKNQINDGQQDAILFIGCLNAEGLGDGDPGEPVGFLHVGSRWIILILAEETLWEVDKEDVRLLGTWSGGTAMLRRAVKAALKDPDLDFPVTAGRTWQPEVPLGTVEGHVSDAVPVDPDGDGRVDLFVASSGGDRLFRWKGEGMEDITGAAALSSRSAAFAWDDINRDGHLDLASWDGEALKIYAGNAEGTFSRLVTLREGLLAEVGCKALTTVDTAADGRVSLLVLTDGMPLLITPTTDREFTQTPLWQGALPADEGTTPRALLCADLDGDLLADVLLLFPDYSLLFRGRAGGAFAAPVRATPALGKGESAACLTDFDADGLLDVCTVAGDGNRLWQNDGKGVFTESIGKAGEIYYISKPGGTTVRAGDVNNDGRQDILIAHGEGLYPQLFFNRGFRSYGHARMLDLQQLKVLPAAAAGQSAACFGDFNHDGALDLCLVLKDGSTWVLPRAMEGKPDLAVFAALSAGLSAGGPVQVSAEQFGRPLGTSSLRASAPACFGTREPGPVTLHWQFPGRETRSKECVVDNQPVYLFLDKE